MLALSAAALLLPAPVVAAEGQPAAPRLGLPVDCDMQSRCAIQKYVDLDASAERRDYRCGRITTDGHDGTDIRLRRFADLDVSAPVIAAAGGRVLRVRDGMADANVRDIGMAAIGERLAGNGVVIDHGDGWETQYSHMKRGSIAVRPGQTVAAGSRLGMIGMSGNAEFPHLHFEVRRSGTEIDPFSGRAVGQGCGGAPHAMWNETAARALHYRAPQILAIGLAASPEMARAARVATAPIRVGDDPAALIIWADAVGAQDGDDQLFLLRTADGKIVFERKLRVVRGGLSWFAFAGMRRPAGGWPATIYKISYVIERNGKILDSQEGSVTLK